MAQGNASGERPSIGEANVALASLLSALKQSSASATAGGPASSPAGQAAAAASSPAAAAPGLTPQTGGPIAQHSSPAFPTHRRNLSSTGSPPPPSSSNAPTPSLAGDTPKQQQHDGHNHPHGTNWSGQTAAELSELGTYELLLQLGAHLGVMKPPPSTSQAGATETTTAGTALQGNRHSNVTSTATRATPSHAPTAPTPGDSGLRDSTYRPQPTRSGRMPQQSRPSNGPGDVTDPSMSTLLFNDFFDFPSSEDEDDDPDFDPNAPADDFWGDLLARERADGDLTENEDAGWATARGNGSGAGGSDAGAGKRSSGITSDEFAREIALLTSALNDPLPDLSGRSAMPPQPTRTSPRRARTAATAFIPSPAEEMSEPVAAPARKKRKTTRRTLSPVLEDMPAGSSDSRRHDSSSRDVLPPPGQPLASLSPKVRRTQVALPVPIIPSRYDAYDDAADAGQRQVGPPSSSVASPSASPPPEAEAVPRTTRKYRQRERVYTPEEAAERRRVQQAERMAVRRKEEKEKKAQEEARVKGIEQENATLRERCRWLEEKCRDLEAKLEAAFDDLRPSRGTASSSRLRARPRRRSVEEPTTSKGRSAATNGSSAKPAVSVAGTNGVSGDDDESDGGEYQVESSEESSSSNEDAEDRAVDEDDLTPLAFPTDSPATQAGTPTTHPPRSSSGLAAGAGTAAPAGPVSLDLSSMGGPALSQLLTLVHAAANAQGIPMPTATTNHK